jgi:hypothetical protein
LNWKAVTTEADRRNLRFMSGRVIKNDTTVKMLEKITKNTAGQMGVFRLISR